MILISALGMAYKWALGLKVLLFLIFLINSVDLMQG